MSACRVSVLIPTFNRAHFLGEAIDGVLGQSRPATEVIVIDDGSTDDTRERVSAYGDRVRYLRQDNSGKSVALNRGLEAACGDAIWVFDDDDVPRPDALERLVQPFLHDAALTFSFGLYDYLFQDGGVWRTAPVPPANPDGDEVRLAVLRQCYIHQPGMLVAAQAYRDAGPFDTTMLRSQDYEMLLRLVRRGRACEVAGLVFSQRQHAGLRGPGSELQAANRSRETWRRYDGVIFERIYRTYGLNEFVPEARRDDEGLALVSRLAVMARRGLWPEATADLRAFIGRKDAAQAGRLPLTPAAARQFGFVFDWAGHGLQTSHEAAEFFQVLETAAQPLRRSIAKALSRPMGGRVRSALKGLDRSTAARAAATAGKLAILAL